MKFFRSHLLIYILVIMFFASCRGVKNMATASLSEGPYDSYRGLVMAGYQGWFNAEGDTEARGFHHYTGPRGFCPGSASVDFWPDVTEYELTYPTAFRMPDGSAARVFSSSDSTTVDTHFRWMKEYGLDGVFMQRFLTEILNPSGKKHFDTVLDHAMTAANRHNRAISVMYDLSGVSSKDCDLILSDADSLARKFHIFDRQANPSYLYHNGRPLIAVWGIGFNDGRKYSLSDTKRVVDGLKERGFSVLVGVPTNWRTLDGDTESNPLLHEIILESAVVMPWFVGRYDEAQYEDFKTLIAEDIKWSKQHNVDYAPLVYPGFSWKNMCGQDSFYVPRNEGKFFSNQINGALNLGAEMLYVAMFDEIDEGTAIFKCAKTVPVAEEGTAFEAIDANLNNDFYLSAAGKASRKLKKRLQKRTSVASSKP